MGKPLWSEKYRPQKFTQLSFTADLHFRALEWLSKQTKKHPILLINGPCSVGKTTLVKLLAKTMNYNLVEKFDLGMSTQDTNTINGRPNLIFVDDIDGYAMHGLTKFIKHDFRYPVVLTSTNLLLPDVHTLKLALPSLEVLKLGLRPVMKGEKVVIDNQILVKMAEHTNYDFRAIINYLQASKSKTFSSSTYEEINKLTPLKPIKWLELVFSKSLRWRDFEAADTTVMSMCYNSFILNTTSMDTVREILVYNSEIDLLGYEYKPLVLTKYNTIRSKPYVFVKNEVFEERFTVFNKDVMMFLENTKVNKGNEREVEHYNSIISLYKLDNMNAMTHEPAKCKITEKPALTTFRFLFREGSSMAVKKDIAIWALFSQTL